MTPGGQQGTTSGILTRVVLAAVGGTVLKYLFLNPFVLASKNHIKSIIVMYGCIYETVDKL